MAQNDGLPFGKKLSEVIAENNAQKVEPTEPIVTEPTVVDPAKVNPAKTEPKIEPKTEPVKNDWLEHINKTYKTEYKSPEEFGKVFDEVKKTKEYETKITEYTNNEVKYKKQLEELQSSLNPLTYFSSQDAFVAEQLKKQRKDLDPHTLGDIVSNNTDSMSDVDVLIKNELLKNPKLIGREKGAEGLIFKRYGIDPTIPKEEWDITTQNEMLVAANAARKEWSELKNTVQLPKVVTDEERETERAKATELKRTQIAPLKETFTKFDKFTEEIEPGKILEFNVPDEYKDALPDMFEAYFVDAGLEVSKENLDAMEELKGALLLKRHIKQIYKTIEGDVETRMRAERDALLNNTNPTKTQSATELGGDEKAKHSKEHGLGKLVTT